MMKRGFTLIELLVVVSLVGLLMGWSVPEFIKFNRRRVQLAAADQLVSDLRLLQNLAENGVRGQGTAKYEFWLDGSGQSYQLCREDCSTEVLKVRRIDGQVVLSPSGLAVDFSVPTGNLVGTAVEFSVCHLKLGGELFTVSVEKSGRIFRSERKNGC